ncbi:MAG: hypothetical protein ACI3Z5_04185 [Paludibacteraceae bacterium]
MNLHRLVICCLQAILCFSLSAKTVTYTVTSKTTVLADGDEPVGSFAEYSQTGTTGQRGQMTAGNLTSLILNGFQDLRLCRITLVMRSNKSAGAGSLEVRAGEDVLWKISPAAFSDEEWAGRYTTDWTTITCTLPEPYAIPSARPLSITIAATVNSLYIQSYTIEYKELPIQSFTIDFRTHTDTVLSSLTEAFPGAGVVLRDFDYTDDVWHFVGWRAEPLVEETESVTSLLLPGTKYFPDENTVLHAVYADGIPLPENLIQDTLHKSGYYTMADARYSCIATSAVNADGRLHTKPILLEHSELYSFQCSDIPQNAVYYIDFDPHDSTASVTHVASGRPIGYNPSRHILQRRDTTWRYSVLPNHTVQFFFDDNNITYSLRAITGTNLATIDSLWYHADTSIPTGSENILFRVDEYLEPPAINYTSYPQGLDALPQTEVLPLVITSEGIFNPQGVWFAICNMQGNRICATNRQTLSFAEEPLSCLMPGIYILYSENYSRCFLLP